MTKNNIFICSAALVPIPEDFWAAMEDSNRSEKNSRCLAHIQDQSARIVSLAGIMERWTKQLGVPVVQAFRNYSAKSEITFTQVLKQSKFLNKLP